MLTNIGGKIYKDEKNITVTDLELYRKHVLETSGASDVYLTYEEYPINKDQQIKLNIKYNKI
jgi:hypothetical protein